MIAILGMALQVFLILFIMGAGFTAIFLPKTLKQDSFWLIPWCGIILIAMFGVIFNLAQVPLSQSKYILFAIAGVLFIYALISKKRIFYFNKEIFLLALLVLISLLYNLFPLIIRVGFPTTISLGNLDPLSYTTVADFLTKHTIFDGKVFEHFKPYLWSTGDLLHSGYRWGSPMILSFIASILGVRAYVVYFILLVLSFVLSFPPLYILAKRMIPKNNLFIMILVFMTFTFNSTILYMVYNVFYAQFLFSGIYMLIFLLIYEYFKNTTQSHNFNFFDFLIGLSISSITTIYPEGLVFILIPLGIATFLYMAKDRSYVCGICLIKILAVAFVINPYTFGTAVEQSLKIILSSTRSVFIGWDYIPFAAPLEMMGFYNLYYSKDLPAVIDFIIGIPIIIVWLVGLKKLKSPFIMTAYMLTFTAFYIGLRFIYPNFFTYHRAIIYSLFIYPILFTSGIIYVVSFFHKNFKYVIIAIIFILVSRSAYRTTYQIYWHMRIVDHALISLQEFNLAGGIPQPFYTSDVFLGEYDLWRRLWHEYFLMNKLIVTRQNFPTELSSLPKNKLVLAEKEVIEYQGKKLKFKNIVWENKYYQLGEIESISYADDLKKLLQK